MDSTFSLPPQVITHDTTYFKLLDAQFVSRALATGAKHLRGSRWPTHAVFPADAPEVIATAYYEAQHSFEALLDLDGAIAQLVRRGDGAVLRVAAKNEESLERAEAELRRRLPEPTGHQAVNVDFWHWEDDRSTWTSRSIPVPSLSEVEGNYTRAADAELRWLVDEFRPDSAGRLVLWHGPPGCGKTWALRALAWEWRDWCAVKYVIDPEVFLNEPGYMVRLLHQRASGQQTDRDWSLIVMEDTGELLSADAKERAGQGLSRMLNMVDGLLGQSAQALFLVTTNEDLRSLHPAISRPGRCGQVIEFGALSVAEANAWLERAGVAERVFEPATLAELYALREGLEVPAARPRAVGFG